MFVTENVKPAVKDAPTDAHPLPPAPQARPFAVELAFTAAYRKFQAAPPPQREAECLKTLFPAVMRSIQEGDMLAGRIRYPMVGFSPEAGGMGYYCLEKQAREALGKSPLSGQEQREVEEMLAFWENETTQAKTIAAYPQSVRDGLSSMTWEFQRQSGIAFPLYRMGGVTLDLGKLLDLGLPGLAALIETRRSQAADEQTRSLCLGMLTAMDVLKCVCGHYANQAREAGNEAMAESLVAVAVRAPRTMREAIQLSWLYVLLSGTWNYGRMDVYLGPFLARDLASGELTYGEALGLLQSFWRLITAYDNMFNNRIFIGGKGRPDEAAADQFALLAIEATRTVITNQPQLSLRFYKGQNPALMKAALTCLGEGRTFPILYNDDVNIPAVAAAFHVDISTAAEYMPYGCGEYTINHASTGTPNGLLNLLKALEITLHDGVDPLTGQPFGIKGISSRGFTTFEDLWNAYSRQVEFAIEALAWQEKITYDVCAEAAPFLLISILSDDCLERGKGIFGGGSRYAGGTLESYGNINTADSLAAIRKLVYEDGEYTLEEIIRACDANFRGYEALRRRMLDAPKFGNDDEEADEMAKRVHEHVCKTASAQAAKVGLDTYLVVVINNNHHTVFGRVTAASADGRLSGTSMANAINPSPGHDRNGVTAFLNSLVKIDPAIHAGTVQNMKFSRGMFTRRREKLEALLTGYFRSGGTQAMITVVDRHDLEGAMREPEKWGHLMVRVGGFSARFIDLPHDLQIEVLDRTLNE